MFKNILMPISSEFYSEQVIERGAFLAEKFKSDVNLIYIIEEKTLNQADKIVDSYISPQGMQETKKGIIETQKLAADEIIFKNAKTLFENKKISFKEGVVRGEFSDVVKDEISKNDHDLIIIGFEKECILNYRLLSDVEVPVWIESNNDSKSILAVCSNLAPNQKVPAISEKLSKALNWELQMIYVIDMKDKVQVDQNEKRSGNKTEEELILIGQNFVGKMKSRGLNVQLMKGSLEKETIKAAENLNAGLVIVGREQKERGLLGFPVKNIKRKMAEKCRYSILFIN